ncbi:MAG: DUF3833 domain-containing protein [Betaproteobacteria bacterium]|nr:DUF3833 domain-containing protein [Betaproteobacteria bacterium]MBK6600245.1 DUF3833 domain-containing protein [Betaproteobacteria bacterium]MBK7080723.1 DUF3833 domain-containing protein [Betaproteobacteria bacterium]MBK7742424.1 DUF3833 domain-containing protein [Betaproteobacteria bacterium]MBK8690443.1 DUF3833 domain-containing protein [Betaproteobacteria bacterium]
MIFKSSLAVLAVAGLTGCAAVDVAEYRAEKPAFDLARYFNGTVDGWGMFQDRSGKVVRRFTVRIDARWDGDTGTLDEHFEYADGEKQNRVWKLVKKGDRYEGTAADVVGTGSGIAAGNAFNLKYVLALPVDGKVWEMDMDDWMYMIDEQTVLNRTTMTKFGFRVGDVTLSFRKR